jgi:2-C-methyl-D-erythritol 2,4-cyclodiphosphate synthase
MDLRVGLGFDAHRFADPAGPPRPLVVGGVRISDSGGLVGHSDADVVCHALADAMLGAAGQGDLGTLFPAHDPQLSGADSWQLLCKVRDNLSRLGWSVVNADVAVAAEKPALAPYVAQMEQRLREGCGGPVRVAPKRVEGMGALGRREGVAAWAVVLLQGDRV